MANEKDITLGLRTVGADAAAAEIDKVPKALDEIPEAIDAIPKSVPKGVEAVEKGSARIVDATKRSTAATEENKKAFKEWQLERQRANREAGTSSVALTRELQEQEKAANQAAAAASNLAAQEEAAAIRRGIAAKNLTDELLEEAKRRKAQREELDAKGLLGVDLSGGAEKVGQLAANKAGFGGEFRALSQVISADAAAVAGSFAAIGAAAVASYKALDGTLERFDSLRKLAKETGQSLGPDLELQLEALRETIGPVKTVIDSVGDALEKVWKTVKDPVGELSGANELEAAFRRQAELAANLLKMRRDMATSKVAEIESIYQGEASKLKEQEETMRRIIQLRQEIGNIEQQRANNQVRIAKQDGGDVALAEANALAVELRSKQQELVENLRQAQADQKQLVDNFRAADLAYRSAITEGLDKVNPEEFAELSKAYDTAQEAINKGKETLPLIEQKFRDAQVAAAEDVEIKLIDLRDKYGADLSKQASAAFNSITDTLRTSLSTGPEAAIAQIQVEAGAIVTAANEQAAQVRQGLGTERAGTVQAILQLAPQPQDTAAIVQAVQGVGRANAEQGNIIIAALAAVQAGMAQTTARLARQEAQINQLFGRLR